MTLLFTDIEGSTRAWEIDETAMAAALARHDALLRELIESAGGYVFKTVGDAFCAAFSEPGSAIDAAASIQRAVAAEDWAAPAPLRVRIALHSGACDERDGDYFGRPVNRVARLEAIAHGGQTLMSDTTAKLLVEPLTAGIRRVDLGEHRLKDLDRPERVWGVLIDGLETEFPPLRSLSDPRLRTNLPVQATSFLGRGRELADMAGLLASSRLVTVVGPGGVGKTRLALQAVVELLDGSGDGVWLVELASVTDPEGVVEAVTRALGLHEATVADALAHLVEVCADRNTLVVLDNCEHLIDAVASMVDRLMTHCPNVQIVATSREPLEVDGEQLYRLAALDVPEDDALQLEQLVAVDSVRLFVERAAGRRPGFVLDDRRGPLVASICRRLDGIPLAIELAAARVDTMTIEQLHDGLDERFRVLTSRSRTRLPRQKTLEALVEWSWDLLTDAERTLLACTSVFVGSWDLSALEAVAPTSGLDRHSIATLLDSLVTKSLVQADEAAGALRYRLLETVRDYARTKLADHPEIDHGALRVAHRDHYLGRAVAAAPHLRAHGQREWLDALERDYSQISAAIDHCVHDTDPRAGMRFGAALGCFWLLAGHANEGVEALTALLARSDTVSDPSRGEALRALTDLLLDVDNEAMAALADEELTIARASHHEALTIDALGKQAWAAVRRGDLAAALSAIDAALTAARAHGDRNLLADEILIRAAMFVEEGRSADARACYEEALDLYHDVGNVIHENMARSNLAGCLLIEGDLATARAHATVALATAPNARRTAQAAFTLGLVELLDGNRAPARAHFAEEMTNAWAIGDQGFVADALFGLALAAAPDRLGEAAAIHGAVDAGRARIGQPDAFDAHLRATHLALLRAQLGDEAFEAHYARGQAMPRAEVIQLALRPAEVDPTEGLTGSLSEG